MAKHSSSLIQISDTTVDISTHNITTETAISSTIIIRGEGRKIMILQITKLQRNINLLYQYFKISYFNILDSPDCINDNRDCDYWASIDECNKNPSYMLVNCKKACNTCNGNYLKN